MFFRDLLSAFGLGQKKINNILNQSQDEGSDGGLSKLEQLLSEEETIQECKSQNQRLIDFLSRKENLSQLIRFATRIPEDPHNRTIANKYPFVAAEILSNSAKLADAFIEELKQEFPTLAASATSSSGSPSKEPAVPSLITQEEAAKEADDKSVEDLLKEVSLQIQIQQAKQSRPVS